MREKNNKIMIICPSMWPKMNSWGETQRMYYLSNYLSQHGWEVYTVSPGFGESSGNSEREKYYKSCFLGVYKSAGIPQKEQDNKRKSIGQSVRNLAAGVLMPMIDWVYNEPDSLQGIYKQLWVWKYEKKIYQLIDERKVGTVIISVPAFILVKLAKGIHKKFPDIKIIYDYRDSWHLWNRKKNLAYYREKKYLSYADQVIGFSHAFSNAMVQIMGVPESKMGTVYNGFSEKDWKKFEQKFHYENKEKRRKLRLAFVGNITLLDRKDNFRNPCNLIEVVNSLDEVELYFVGIKDSRVGTVDKNVHYIATVSQEESFQYMMTSDVLVNIHDTQDDSGKYMITGKFFDYMRSGKVMWHIGAPETLMVQMIQEYQLGIWCENSKEALRNSLIGLIQRWQENSIDQMRNGSIEQIGKFSRENQNKQYSEII